MLTKPTLSIAVEYENPLAYYALSRADHRQIERSLVGTVKTHFPPSLLDAWAVLDPSQVGVGGSAFDVADESLAIANVRAFVDRSLETAGNAQNVFRTLDSQQFTPARVCIWIDMLHKDTFSFFLERNGSGAPYKLTGTSSSGKSATAFIRVEFGFEEPAKSGA